MCEDFSWIGSPRCKSLSRFNSFLSFTPLVGTKRSSIDSLALSSVPFGSDGELCCFRCDIPRPILWFRLYFSLLIFLCGSLCESNFAFSKIGLVIGSLKCTSLSRVNAELPLSSPVKLQCSAVSSLTLSSVSFVPRVDLMWFRSNALPRQKLRCYWYFSLLTLLCGSIIVSKVTFSTIFFQFVLSLS